MPHFPRKKKAPTYMNEYRQIRDLLQAGEPMTFTHIFKAVAPEAYKEMNRRRARVLAALNKLVAEGSVSKEERRKEGRVLYSLKA